MKKLLNIILATVIVAIMLSAIGCTDNTNDPLATPAPTESPITEPIVEPQPTPTVSIIFEPVDNLPDKYWKAYFNVSPVGGNPRFTVYDDQGLTFYAYEKHSDTYYKGTLSLPDGYEKGRIVTGISGAGSGEVFLVVLAEKDGEECYIQYDLIGWYPECKPSFDAYLYFPDSSTGGEQFVKSVNAQIEQHKAEKTKKDNFPALENVQLTPTYEKTLHFSFAPAFAPEFALFDVSPVGGYPRYIVGSEGMAYFYCNHKNDFMYRCILPLPEGFIDGKIVFGLRGAGSGEVDLYVSANHENGESYYIRYSYFGWDETPTIPFATVINPFDEDGKYSLSELSRHMDNHKKEQNDKLIKMSNSTTFTLDPLLPKYTNIDLNRLAEGILGNREIFKNLEKIEFSDGVIDVIYDEYGQLYITSITVFGHTVTLDEPWQMHGNRITKLFRADVGQPAYVFEIGTGMLNWWIFTEDGIAKELQSLPEVAEYNKIDTYLYVGDSGELLYTLTPQKYCQIHSYNDLFKYIVAVDEFAEERGYITVENCQTVYHPENQSTIEELFGVIDMFAWWKNHISENPDIYTDKMIEAIGMFAKAETLEEYLEYNAQQYERAYSPHGELPK